MKLGLGTAQFGLDYGIANSTGRVPPDEVRRILEQAWKAGVTYLDTAPSYGISEVVVGESLSPTTPFHIITKTPRLDTLDASPADVWTRSLEASFRHLRVKSLYGLLVHHAQDLLGADGEARFKLLKAWKAQGLVQKVGVSVYTGDEIDQLLERYDLDLVQVPFNLFDQRLVKSGHLKRLQMRGVEVHARSIFLQGLLLMNPKTLHAYFEPWRGHLAAYAESLTRQQSRPIEAAVQFVVHEPAIHAAVFGVCSTKELEEILQAYQSTRWDPQWKTYAVEDEGLVDPRLWKVA